MFQKQEIGYYTNNWEIQAALKENDRIMVEE